MKLRIARIANAEAREAADWYDGRRSSLGTQFLAAVDAAYVRIASDPQTLPREEHYDGIHDVRRLRVEGFPFDVLFVCLSAETVVIAVAHHQREPLYWIDRMEAP